MSAQNNSIQDETFGPVVYGLPEHDGKADTGKAELALVDRYFPLALEGVAKVCTFGKEKYGVDTWHDVPNANERYQHAMRRHQLEIQKGFGCDEESTLNHYAHVAWNALALCQLEYEKLAAKK